MDCKGYIRALAPAAIVGLLLAGLIGCAPAATVTPSPAGAATAAQTPGTCCTGQRCVAGGVALTVRSVSTAQTVEGAGTPQPGNTLLAADVTIENVGSQAVTYSPEVFQVRTSDGTEVNASTIVPDETGNPGPGETALLRVVFEVPEGASGRALIYSPPELGEQPVQVDLTCQG